MEEPGTLQGHGDLRYAGTSAEWMNALRDSGDTIMQQLYGSEPQEGQRRQPV